MAEPTYTRQNLRRLIARELGMVYPQRTGKDSNVLTTVTSTTVMRDSFLAGQPDSFWTRQSLMLINGTATSCRSIRTFTGSTGELTVEYPFSYTPVVGDTYEIHGGWDSNDIHAAINRAIEDAFPAFFDNAQSTSIVLQEDKTTYDVSSLNAYVISAIFFEQPKNIQRGTVTATNAPGTTLTDSTANWTTNEHAGKLVSIYDSSVSTAALGTAVTVVSNTATALTVVFAGAITAGDKYALWSSGDEVTDWARIIAGRLDTRVWPNTLYLTQVYSQHLGLRVRIEYIKRGTTLSAETDTTVVPQEFIVDRALAMLYEQKLNDNRYDRQRFMELASRKTERAERYRASRAWTMPSMTFWQESEQRPEYRAADGDPLGWLR